MAKTIGFKNVNRKCNCKECGAIVQYESKDVEPHTVCSFGEDIETFYYVSCPECSQLIKVPSWQK